MYLLNQLEQTTWLLNLYFYLFIYLYFFVLFLQWDELGPDWSTVCHRNGNEGCECNWTKKTFIVRHRGRSFHLAARFSFHPMDCRWQCNRFIQCMLSPIETRDDIYGLDFVIFTHLNLNLKCLPELDLNPIRCKSNLTWFEFWDLIVYLSRVSW